ncbi:MAG TPA: hypothetical protein VIP28_13260 [Nocardioides sp.]
MGAGNVKLVYVNWGHLPDRAFRLLAFMALTSVDREDQPTYYGGRRSLALSGLGRPVPNPHDDSPEVEKARNAVYQDVKKQIRILTDAKAIRRINDPGGRDSEKARYLLRLRPELPVDNSSTEDL